MKRIFHPDGAFGIGWNRLPREFFQNRELLSITFLNLLHTISKAGISRRMFEGGFCAKLKTTVARICCKIGIGSCSMRPN